MANETKERFKVGDFIHTRGLFGIELFAQVKKVERLDDGNLVYIVEGPDGEEFNSYGPQKLTKQKAAEWAKTLKQNIKFLEKI